MLWMLVAAADRAIAFGGGAQSNADEDVEDGDDADGHDEEDHGGDLEDVRIQQVLHRTHVRALQVLLVGVVHQLVVTREQNEMINKLMTIPN